MIRRSAICLLMVETPPQNRGPPSLCGRPELKSPSKRPMSGLGPVAGRLLQETDAPPLAISARRAESFGGVQGTCEFAPVQREGAGWRTRARCSANGKSWTANVQLRVTGSTLSWSSERGRAIYYRCPPIVSATR